MTDPAPNIAAMADRIRWHLRGRTGRSFWRSLDELTGTIEFEAAIASEFPSMAALPLVDRRSMMKIMGASLALAGLAGCDGTADEEALPYVNAPEGLLPGMPKWYATSVLLGGFALPVLGKTHAGRPIKLEGNPDHPATRGGTDPFLQAALLGLYDPDRSQEPRHQGRPASWSAFDGVLADQVRSLDARGGEGFRLLTGNTTSPTFLRQIDGLLARWPNARWHVLEPIDHQLLHQATTLFYGRALDRHLALDRAETIVCFDDDLLGPGPWQARHAGLWSERRRAWSAGDGGCHLLVAEPTPSLTGAKAAGRLIAGSGRMAVLLHALAAALGLGAASASGLSDRESAWVTQAASRLQADAGRSFVGVGIHHPAELQALGLAINERLGNVGSILRFTAAAERQPLEALADEIVRGEVSLLMMLETNPAYASPADPDFRRLLETVPTSIHAGLHYDETARLSTWHLPLPHDLERWSDARAVDGTVTILQPLIKPLYPVRSVHSLVDALARPTGRPDRDIVQETWREDWPDRFEERWRAALVRGFVPESALDFLVPVASGWQPGPAPVGQDGLVLAIRPDPAVWDGRFANNAWLQELPRPFSKVTWGNVLQVGPGLARERGWSEGDEVRLEAGGRAILGPIWITPGQDDRTVVATLGYGRGETAGRVAAGLGYDAYLMRSSAAPWHVGGVTLTATGRTETVATTQLHQAMEGRDFVRTLPVAEGQVAHEAGDQGTAGHPPSFYPDRPATSPSWGMSIDLDLCIGCNACVAACVSENNIPTVGKELVAQGREMHWIRVDHYYEGDPEKPRLHFQPVPCMHCEQAPCEMGCPVNATVHSTDGLNVQVYNRCIGTRTCSSYCPYKVRRFNWFDFTEAAPPLEAARNPDVTVRARGVMEKCTYCVQRISRARIAAKREDRPIRDGEIVPACQQACPATAILFGDVTDPLSAVSRAKASPRNYALLAEVNTRPRTTYLARLEEPEHGA